ncbi:hypothetical protein L210DRAFT_3767239 [Boletus edulis BED1]|uniref:SAP domain-containing protein n=1 Tax=Boletus edulis BED1 TaxID=1328754 RepID=A0AAD4BCG2_BOLED|nr:hypothetical protein L210DRAFT_3767239 [Boletus edulis BED1]
MSSPELAVVERFHLPEPGQTFTPGVELKTFEFVITNKTTKQNLQNQLHLYGLPVNGTKPNLLAALREFSRDHDAWFSLFRPAKKRKRGVHNSRSSLSTKRIATQFGEGDESAVIAYKSKKSVNRVQRALTDQDRTANTDWAGAILEALGVNNDFSPASPTKQRRTENTAVEENSAVDNSAERDEGCSGSRTAMTPAPTDSEGLTARVRRLERKLDQGLVAVLGRVDSMQDALSSQIRPTPPVSCLATAESAPSPDTSPPHVEPVSASGQQEATLALRVTAVRVSATEPTSQHTETHQESIPAEFLGIAHLDPPHTEFTFDIRYIPDPPAINFSNDIDRLFREWEVSTLLVINGHGVPVKHWGQFYKKAVGAKDTAWDALKTKWGKWKFIVEERSKYTDDTSFWHQFSTKKGERLRYQQILNRIASARITSDAQDAANARLFFGGNLEHPTANGAFRYTRSGKSYVLTKDSAVAKAWRTLLTTQPIVAEQWEALRALQHAVLPDSEQ